MKKTFFVPFIIVFLTIAVWMIGSVESVQIRIAPKTVLTSAIQAASSQLKQRFQNDPMLLLLSTLDPEGKYTAEISATASAAMADSVNYDMIVKTDGKEHRFFASGIVSVEGKNLDISLYLDRSFAAISSQELVPDKFYGITYDTFSQDIRNLPMISFFAGNHTIEKWSESIRSIQLKTEELFVPAGIFDPSAFKIEPLMLGLLTMPCEIETQAISVGGNYLDCECISFRMVGAEAGKYLAALSGDHYGSDTVATISFYLHNRSLVRTSLNGSSGSNSVQYIFELGKNLETGPIILTITQQSDEDKKNSVFSVETYNTDSSFSEVWQISKNINAIASEVMIAYDWNLSNGQMLLQIAQDDTPLVLTLLKTESGFKIISEDILKLLQALFPNISFRFNQPITAAVNVFRGAEFDTPEYINLEKWSSDDLFALIQGIGSLFGIDLSI